VPAVVWYIVVGRAVNRVGAFTLPFLAILLTRERGLSASIVGLVLAAFGVATIPSRVAGGWLADHVGRRTTILAGLTGCAFSQLSLAAIDGVVATVGSVVVLGLFFELYEPPSQALIADAVEPRDRTSAYGLLSGALAAAGTLAGLLAVLLTQLDLRLLFVVDALTCLACAIVLRVALPKDRPFRACGAPRVQGHRPWRDGRLILLTVIGTMFAIVYLQTLITLPLTLLGRGFVPSVLGVLLTTSAVTIVVGQPLLRWTPVREAAGTGPLITGYLLLGCGLVGYGFARSLVTFAAATVLAALGDLLLMGRLLAIVATLAPDGARARYLAAFGLSWGAAGVIAPLAGTFLLAQLGIAGTWSVLAGLCLLLAVVQPAVSRRLVSGESPSAARLAG
jgi:MFS family permease